MPKPMSIAKWRAKSRWIAPGEVLTRIGELDAKLTMTADYRERQSHAKALAFCCTSAAVSEAEFSIDSLALIIAAGLKAKRNGGATELLGSTLLHLVRRRLDLLGVGEPAIVAEKKKRVAWEGGCVAIGSAAAVVRSAMASAEREIIGNVNSGSFYMVNVGCDGGAPLTLRIVDFVEPMLSSSEFAKTEAVSNIGWLNVENSKLLAGAAEALEDGPQLSVAPGRYLVRLFSIGSRLSSRLIFVVCRSQAPVDAFNDMPSL